MNLVLHVCVCARVCVDQGGVLRMHGGFGRVNLHQCPSGASCRCAGTREKSPSPETFHRPPSESLQDCLETFLHRVRVVLCRRRRVSLSCGASLLQTRIGNHYACGSPAISAEMSGYQGKKNIPRITVSTNQQKDGLKTRAIKATKNMMA